MKKKLFIILLASVFIMGAMTGFSEEDENILKDSKGLFKQVQLFADAIILISTDYVKPIKVKDLVYGAIRGMMNTLDGYSQFLDPDSFKDITEETKGEFGGLGVEIGMRKGVLTVIAPIEGTPAYESGIQPEDKIVKIDGEVTRDMTLDDAVKKLRGEPGSKVIITVLRENGDQIIDIPIIRAVIKIKSIKEARLLEGNIIYIKLVEFQERTSKDLRKAIKEFREAGAKSMILDLRNNPGGLLDASVEVADMFLHPDLMIVYTEGRDPEKRTEYISKRKCEFEEMDIIVMVNKGSASASEILAGALKDNKRALVIGTTTFGKGSVQTVIPLKDNSALKLTTAAYYTPSGKNLMNKGVEPDIYVERIKSSKKAEWKHEKKGEEGKEEENKKGRIFDRFKGKDDKKEVEKQDLEKKEVEMPEIYDSQMQVAVNILKGIRIFDDYKAIGKEKQEAGE